jgi:glycosyltransferase involved in cell wall biosynthesis
MFWAFLIPFLKKKNTFLILRDLYPKWLVDNKILKEYSISYYFLKFVENLLYRQCNKIFVQTRKDLKYLKKFKNNKTKLFTLENWVTEKGYIENEKQKKRKYIRFLFTGVIGIAQDYNKLLEMIRYCEFKNYKSFFYFVGSGSKKEEFILKTKNFKNVIFFNNQNQNKLDKIILKCHICLSTLSDKFKSDNFPGKILRYMLFNKPILIHAPGNNYLSELIENNKLGLFSSTDDQLRNNLDTIFSEKNFLNEYGNNGVSLIKGKFSTINAIKKLFKI